MSQHGAFSPTHDFAALPLSRWRHRIAFLRAASQAETGIRRSLVGLRDEHLLLLNRRVTHIWAHPRRCLATSLAIRRCATMPSHSWHSFSVDLLDLLGRYHLTADWCIDSAISAIHVMLAEEKPGKLKHRQVWRLPQCGARTNERGIETDGWVRFEFDFLPFDPRIVGPDEWLEMAHSAADEVLRDYLKQTDDKATEARIAPVVRERVPADHYRWAALSQVCGTSKQRISDDEGVSRQAVQKAVRNVLDLIGLDPAPPAKGGRPRRR